MREHNYEHNAWFFSTKFNTLTYSLVNHYENHFTRMKVSKLSLSFLSFILAGFKLMNLGDV